MTNTLRRLFFFWLFGLSSITWAHSHDIALTLDDLPFVGEQKNFHLKMIIDTLKSHDIPATGFVIAGNVQAENWPVLQQFKAAGFGVGNHTLSHASAATMSTNAYIQQIGEADKILSPVLTKPKYFRYPYLAMGEGAKKISIINYLSSKSYHIAPITIDSQDFVFNQLLLTVPEASRRHFMTLLKPCYLDFIWEQTQKAETHSRLNKKTDQAQILLIHSNLLNAYALGEIIDLYQQHGYRFISLEDALKS